LINYSNFPVIVYPMSKLEYITIFIKITDSRITVYVQCHRTIPAGVTIIHSSGIPIASFVLASQFKTLLIAVEICNDWLTCIIEA